MVEVREYIDARGVCPVEKWFRRLNAQAAARVTVALSKLEQGYSGDHKSVGAGVQELRINIGPGYRIYFGKDGEKIIILLGGGTKKKQQRDIHAAQERWKDYKRRKRLKN
ncbi:putative addiction module killer protein [Thiogranum longum]|uniref:Putative addiction module killer protein n=1 Tax=Thiogranum longum TaxID=1537524 RepID=A0A4R1HFB5_9GAMM|nr:type II toxin-antitoxin system RelE/ParE family toxin [Thiogranum longum]TCK19363.1 putative addiction module killer protein [Thiogranum longum]